MKRKLKMTRFAALVAVAAGLLLPASALAEYYVPPGNSAANQYTESLPSAGGESAGKGGGGGTKAPARSLGARNVHKLEAQGPAGEATAEVAAETAPPASLVIADDGSAKGSGNTGGKQHQQGSGTSSQGGQNGGAATTLTNVHVDQPTGSSGIGEVLAQATGSSDDGNLGLWLPLVIVLTVVASIAYRLRPHQGPTV